jgi:hypothetical protein
MLGCRKMKVDYTVIVSSIMVGLLMNLICCLCDWQYYGLPVRWECWTGIFRIV